MTGCLYLWLARSRHAGSQMSIARRSKMPPTMMTTTKKDTDPGATHQAYNAPPKPTSHGDTTLQTAYIEPAVISSRLGPSRLNKSALVNCFSSSKTNKTKRKGKRKGKESNQRKPKSLKKRNTHHSQYPTPHQTSPSSPPLQPPQTLYHNKTS
jgi:hypothetical protein